MHLLAFAAMSCALPDFQKIDDSRTEPGTPDSGTEETPSCPMEIGLTGACRRCVAENCCELARACDGDACGDDIGLPISPVTEVTPEFDALAQCMMDNCDTEDTCDVSWGCVGEYRWPVSREEHPFTMRVFNYADPRMTGMPRVEVRLCESSDPRCTDNGGFITTSTTDSSGNADFTAPKGFSGYFELQGGDPQAAIVQWSQPVYNVVDSFNHQALTAETVDDLALIVGLHEQPGQPFAANTGHLIARMQNCLPLRYLERTGLDSRARDVQFTFSPEGGATRMYYVDNMAMLSRALDRTSSRGYAGAFEVQATNVSVTARHAETQQTLASGVIPLREGTIGYMYLVPSPRD